MTSYVALLRAVNVGGTGKLLMTELRQIFTSFYKSLLEDRLSS